MDTSFSFDGTIRFPTAVPESIAELSGLVRQAAAEKKALYPFGGGTMLGLGLNSTKPGTAVDLRELRQVIDYPARDMTITVQAGITIKSLQELLLAEKQRLPVDIPLPDRATLGGAIAANASGPRRFGLGTLRDYVIGITVINDEGVEVKAGGRVVKNVAGYDMMKLHTGALGTLGIITQVTLKLKPLPESSRLLAISATLDNASAILDALFASRTRPTAIEMLDPAASKAIGALPDGWNILVGFEDNAKAVDWQAEQLKQELPAEVRGNVRECPDTLWSSLRDFALAEADLSFKANLLPSAVVEFCRQASTFDPTPLLQAHAGSGIVIGHLKGLALEQVRPMLEKLGAIAEKAKGNLIVTRCPPAWKSIVPIWGRSTADRVLMKAVKAKLDPGCIFNPGRFVDGI